jgi:hypothetical protein
VEGKRPADEATTELRDLSREFRVKSNLLYGLLGSGRLQAGQAPALRQLLLRLDFNGFADRQAMRAAAA